MCPITTPGVPIYQVSQDQQVRHLRSVAVISQSVEHVPFHGHYASVTNVKLNGLS